MRATRLPSSKLTALSGAVALALTASVVTVSMAACGGSSSETPWPAEPEAAAYAPRADTQSAARIPEDRLDGGNLRRP
jgi:hypothetical protein